MEFSNYTYMYVNFTTSEEEIVSPFVIAISVLHCLTILVTLHMNIMVMLLYGKRCSKSTVVDNLFLLLAITDIFISLCLTNWFILHCFLKTWILPNLMCPVLFLIQTSSVILNAFCICCFLLVISINHTGLQIRSGPLSKAVFITIFFMSLIVSLPGTIKAKVSYDFISDRFFCVDTWGSRSDANAYITCLLVFQYVLPVLLMPVMCNACCQADLIQEDLVKQLHKNKKTKILQIGITTTFAIGWFPQNLLMMLSLINEDIHKDLYFEELWITSNWFSTVACCIYPVFYMNIILQMSEINREYSSLTASNSGPDSGSIQETQEETPV